MNHMNWLAVFAVMTLGISSAAVLAENQIANGKSDQTATENTPQKKERLITLIVILPEGWHCKRFEIPGDGEALSISRSEERGVEDGFGIFRHSGFKTAPYTPEGIVAVMIQASFIPGGLPFNTKDITVGPSKRAAKWLGYTKDGKITDLVLVKHENNVYRISGTYSKDDKAMRDLFWEMVKRADFTSNPTK